MSKNIRSEHMQSRMEQLIDDIENYIDSCKVQPLSGGRKIVVDRDEIDELLSELRHRLPDDIKKYQKIVSNKEAILADARKQADALLNSAREQAEEMHADAEKQKAELIDQHEIMQRAYAQANDIVAAATAHAENVAETASAHAQEILDAAVADADDIRQGAVSYTDEMLQRLQTIISHTMDTANKTFATFAESMQSSYDVVTSNRTELAGSMTEASDEDDEDDYDVEYDEDMDDEEYDD